MALKTFVFRLMQHKKLVNYAPIVLHCGNYHTHNDKRRDFRKKLLTVLFGSVLVGKALADEVSIKSKDNDKVPEKASKKKVGDVIEAGAKKPGLPIYTAEEVSKHDTTDSFWVTYKHGVYDVTSFLPSHPGGEQILNAAGLSIEPFWNVYGMHKTEEIYTLLESYRIGNLRDEDVVDHTDEEMWVKEPPRDRRLIVKTAKPFNAEIPMKLQVQHFDTPNDLFYVRQHMPVPVVEAETHTLRINIAGRRDSVAFTLDDLSKFRQASVRAALMCAGNRRSEMNKVKPVKGLSWQAGAISNAVWSGVYLRDVLKHCGVDMENTHGKHIIFTGSDIDATGHNFSTSIPLHMAVDPSSRILLATHMNGAVLPPDHGYPLRVVVPGAPAVRSVKWLESITIGENESSSHWHKQDYRSFNPSKTWETADFSTAPPVYSLPVTSAICDPADGETVKMKDGCIEIRGMRRTYALPRAPMTRRGAQILSPDRYAYSGGGAKIVRVDISTDRGVSWEEAECVTSDDAPPYHYSWALWTASLPAKRGQMEVWVKATDSNFNTQPEKFDDIWNIRGILSNAYHKINIQVE